jgi:PD-(D/E)XK endonuclease
MTPGRKGAIAEAAIAAEAIRLGFDVYRPVSEGGRYDLIIDTGARLLRAQSKWALLREDVLVIRLGTSRLTPRGYLRTTYTAAEIDGVAAYSMPLDICLWLPIDEFEGQSYLHLRIGPTRNRQRSGVKWARSYPLGAVAQLGERLAGSQKVRGSSPLSST